MTELLEVKHLTKSFGDAVVLNDFSFAVHSREILCILGPNGAGKSTTINILTAALGYDRGDIRFEGQPIGKELKSYRQSLGIVPQDIALYEQLSAEQNLRFFAALYGLHGRLLLEAVDKALIFAGLEKRRHDKVKTFSGGMKRRLNIACAIAHSPKLVIMDEPTVGIDPQSRNYILSSIRKLRDDGMTVIYTTHYLEEVEAISSRIIILDHGILIAEGTKESLKEHLANKKKYTIEVDGNGKVSHDAFFAIEGVQDVRMKGNAFEITSLTGVENLDKIIALLADHGEKIRNITSEDASLEMVFLELTGRRLRD
ncbi:MAG: ABC transporter ATP-binding protein [Spirochaetia bacterium]|nr:ABC transporter ATP-binding protein [Spirochaetia bacterium]